MNIGLLKEDIKNYWLGAAAAVIVCIILDRIFGTCCPLRIAVGLPCPACGTIRSTHALLRLDLKEMLWYQPLLPFIIGTALLFVRQRYFKGRVDKNLFYALTAMLILTGTAVYFYRMYRYYPENPPLEYTSINLKEILIRHLPER